MTKPQAPRNHARRCRHRSFQGALARSAPLWTCYPKKAAGGTLTQADIRAAILDIGLVDYKVCAVDSTWTGLLVRQRKP